MNEVTNKVEYYVLLHEGLQEKHIYVNSIEEAISFREKMNMPNLRIYRKTTTVEELEV